MKPVLTPDQATELDRATQARGTPAADLMERAGWAVARACVDLLGGGYGRRAVVVCGKGNNGGDGFVAARHLARWGMRVAVVPVGGADGLRGPAAENLARLREVPVRVLAFDPPMLARELVRADVAVDALFGTGFRGVADADWASAIDAVNAAFVPVVAVDIPSGVDGTSAAVAGPAVRADLTVTFGVAKTGEVLLPGAELAGDLRVVDIGFPEDLIPEGIGLTEPGDVLAVLPERAVDAHKKASGTLVVVAGSRRMTGAAKLIAQAASRIGAGYVFVATPASILPVIQSELTETVFVPLPETDAGSVAPDALEIVRRVADGADALALGPGLSTEPETQTFIRALVRECAVPFVLDADGLNAFAGDAAAIADRKTEAVVTPHLGELARLTGPNDDRLVAARDLARRADAVALVKGSRTVVARPDGAARINPTGTAVLATAGTGDVLTGAIGGLLARGAEPFDAAWAGAYLHGVAGLVAGQATAEGTVAGDVASRLPEALELVRRQAGGQR